uniref:Uncharacterized protein n=1 Tax=Oryza meridionalis TaxID=40149 RepID=A0A0E0EVC5_9ORYZ
MAVVGMHGSSWGGGDGGRGVEVEGEGRKWRWKGRSVHTAAARGGGHLVYPSSDLPSIILPSRLHLLPSPFPPFVVAAWMTLAIVALVAAAGEEVATRTGPCWCSVSLRLRHRPLGRALPRPLSELRLCLHRRLRARTRERYDGWVYGGGNSVDRDSSGASTW